MFYFFDLQSAWERILADSSFMQRSQLENCEHGAAYVQTSLSEIVVYQMLMLRFG
jgi:hypothetical protein